MTPGTLTTAIARHRAAQAALDAVPRDEELPDDLCAEEGAALDTLAETPCASDAEFLVKLKYLSVEYDGCDCEPLAAAARLHFGKG